MTKYQIPRFDFKKLAANTTFQDAPLSGLRISLAEGAKEAWVLLDVSILADLDTFADSVAVDLVRELSIFDNYVGNIDV